METNIKATQKNMFAIPYNEDNQDVNGSGPIDAVGCKSHDISDPDVQM